MRLPNGRTEGLAREKTGELRKTRKRTEQIFPQLLAILPRPQKRDGTALIISLLKTLLKSSAKA